MSAKGNWKPVTIGGLTGIVLGAGAMYALNPATVSASEGTSDMGNTTPTTDDTAQTTGTAPVIHPVSDDLSFNDAFAAGRAAYGPGGLFTWRGNLYGTFYADEWNAMSDEERDLFADRANTAMRTATTQSPETPEAATEEHLFIDNDVQVAEASTEEGSFTDNDVEVAGETTGDQTIGEKDSSGEPSPQKTDSWDNLLSEDSDVRVIGYGDVDVEGGESVYVEEVEINDRRVAVIDVDKDGEADFMMTDLNHNQQMDEGEVIDLHTGEALTFTNDDFVDDFSDTANTNGSSDVELGAI